MARILFAWELGAGLGHLWPHRSVFQQLTNGGHELHVASRDLSCLRQVFPNLNYTCWQAPFRHVRINKRIQPTIAFPHILHNVGMSDVDDMICRVNAWRNLVDAIKPDVVTIDYAPTLLLALRDRAIPTVIMNIGFSIPPPLTPIPAFLPLKGKATNEELVKWESSFVEDLNRTLRSVGGRPLDSLADLFHAADKRLIRGYKEMDQFPERTDGHYLGIPANEGGEVPEWPSSPRRRVFAYIRPFPNLKPLCELINKLELPTLCYAPGVSDELRSKQVSRTLRFVDAPLDLNRVGAECYFGITNGSADTTTWLLLYGKPVLVFPNQLEQEINAHLVQRMGAGLLAHRKHPKAAFRGVQELLNENKYHVAAQSFAQKHGIDSVQHYALRACKQIHSLI